MKLLDHLREGRARYLERASHLADLRLSPWERVAFVLCTPQTPYEQSVKQWTRWMQTGVLTGPMEATRSIYFTEANAYDAKYGLHRCLWKRESDGAPLRENGRLWAARLSCAVRGLGIVKAPFAVCLMEPLAPDVPVCMDIWMARLFGLPDVASKWRGTMMRDAQNHVKALARKVEMPPFPTQWAAWDWARSAGMQREPLFVKETDIARDLEGALKRRRI